MCADAAPGAVGQERWARSCWRPPVADRRRRRRRLRRPAAAVPAVRTVLAPGTLDSPGRSRSTGGRRVRRRHRALPRHRGPGGQRTSLWRDAAAGSGRDDRGRALRRVRLDSGIRPGSPSTTPVTSTSPRRTSNASRSSSLPAPSRTSRVPGRRATAATGAWRRRAQLDEPTGVAVDRSGDVFIADTANCKVRVVPVAER